MYPPDLISALKEAWPKQRDERVTQRLPLPDDRFLDALFSTCFHASCLREEGRRLAFRVLYYPKSDFNQENKENDFMFSKRVIVFSAERDFSIAEIHRLAPAADYMRSMICVDLNERKEWKIWGLIDVGASWWNFIHHETNMGWVPPNRLTVSSGTPGELAVSVQGEILFTLRSGNLLYPSVDLLRHGIVSDYFKSAKVSLREGVNSLLKTYKYHSKEDTDEEPGIFYNLCFPRILYSIREKSHGGTLIVVPDALTAADLRLAERITIKYPCHCDYVWDLMAKLLAATKAYYDLFLPLMDSTEAIVPEQFKRCSVLEFERKELERLLSDCFKLIASLSSIDGAVVITDRFRLLGFGAEIITLSPTLKTIKMAFDAFAKETRDVSIENYGTRHRAAFRFCSSYEESVAFIVSQDGGIKAVKRCGPDVLMWPDISVGMKG